MAKAKAKARPGAKAKTKRKSTAKPAAKRSTGASKVGGARAAGRARSTVGASTRGSGKGTIGKSGEGLDGGVARRQAGDPGAVGTRPTATQLPSPRKARAQLPGEKAVRDTDQTIPVKPERIPPGETEPMPDVAIDRRRQIVGTDDPGDPADS